MKNSGYIRKRSFRSPQMFLMTLILIVAAATTATTGLFCHAFTTRSASTQSFRTHKHQSPVHRHRLPVLGLKSDGLTPEEREAKIAKATKAMTAFTNSYMKKTGTKLCEQKSIPAVVIKGLAEHKVDLGAPLCPCRFYEDKEKEVKDGYWNCPCVPMQKEKVCHCMLFLTEDNAFAGESTTITVEEVIELTKDQKK